MSKTLFDKVWDSHVVHKINGGPVHTFNEYAAISQNRLYKLKRTINLKTKVLFGCALSTSYNALNNISLKNSKTIWF